MGLTRRTLLLLVLLASGCALLPTHELARVEEALQIAAAIEYADDGPVGHWQMPHETIARGKGDCEDKATYLVWLLAQRDIVDAQVIVGKCKGQGHAWVVWRDYILDPSRQPVKMRSVHDASYKREGSATFWFQKR